MMSHHSCIKDRGALATDRATAGRAELVLAWCRTLRCAIRLSNRSCISLISELTARVQVQVVEAVGASGAHRYGVGRVVALLERILRVERVDAIVVVMIKLSSIKVWPLIMIEPLHLHLLLLLDETPPAAEHGTDGDCEAEGKSEADPHDG